VHDTGRSLHYYQHMTLAFERDRTKAYLVAGEDQSIGDHDILTTTGSKHNNLSNVITSQWLNAPAVC
jgi:hypothetical protein